jgi:hypothetical protein
MTTAFLGMGSSQMRGAKRDVVAAAIRQPDFVIGLNKIMAGWSNEKKFGMSRKKASSLTAAVINQYQQHHRNANSIGDWRNFETRLRTLRMHPEIQVRLVERYKSMYATQPTT